MDEAAEPIPAQNAHTGHVAEWMGATCGRVLLQCPVWPVHVAMAGVLGQDQPQVPLTR